MTRESLFSLRCERRLPLCMNGMIMKGAGPPSRHTPLSLSTLGWSNSIIFEHSFSRPFTRCFSMNPDQKGVIEIVGWSYWHSKLHMYHGPAKGVANWVLFASFQCGLHTHHIKSCVLLELKGGFIEQPEHIHPYMWPISSMHSYIPLSVFTATISPYPSLGPVFSTPLYTIPNSPEGKF